MSVYAVPPYRSAPNSSPGSSPRSSPGSSAESSPGSSVGSSPAVAPAFSPGSVSGTHRVPYRPVGSGRRMRRALGPWLRALVLLVLPVLAAGWYLETRAQDQFASHMGLVVRADDSGSAVALLGGLTELSGGGASDSDILYGYLTSPALVAAVDADLDLRGIWGVGHAQDPVFTLSPMASKEALARFWPRMVRVTHDPSSGLITVRALAFDPAQAQAITQAMQTHSIAMITALADQARIDATRHAQADVVDSLARVKAARVALQDFRTQHQMVDPQADLGTLNIVLQTLEKEKAAAMVELDVLRASTRAGDPRIVQADRRITVIETRLAEERAQMSEENGSDRAAYAGLVGDYERLVVDREFAEQAHGTALTALDLARAEARRTSRYVSAYVPPTLAQSAEYPRRVILLALVALFGALVWAFVSLTSAALRDRR